MRFRDDLPGADVVRRGLYDLARGRRSVEALLAAIGAPRLRALGVRVPVETRLPTDPEIALYRRLARRSGDGAHSEYNALIRRLVSFERALEAIKSRAERGTARGGAASARGRSPRSSAGRRRT
jgi:hypothetical protein